MPKICNAHGIYKEERCPKCKAERDKSYDRIKRDASQKAVYNAKEWRQAREATLLRDMMRCVMCGARATEVDHIIELQDGGARYALDNLQSLCHACHAKKTAEEERKRNLTKP